MATDSDGGGVPAKYYDEPFTLESMSDTVFHGLLAIGVFATLSVLFTSALLSFITWRMISWKSHYTSYIGHNQCIVLIYQLILADLFQALGFVISFYWASQRRIEGPSSVCFAQGWLIQLGDVASGLFVLSVALHTCYQVTLSRSLRHGRFVAGVCGVWAFSVLLTVLAPGLGGRYVFLRAGSWCWISEEHEGYRLGLHYLWIFIVQFGSILAYVAGFYSIWRQSGGRRRAGERSNDGRFGQGSSARALRRAAAAMLGYACVYTVLTLPLAAGRMSTMSSHDPPQTFYLAAGALFTCAGWIDTVLYTITRRTLLFQELNSNRGARRRGYGGGGSSNDAHRSEYYHSSTGRSRASRAWPTSPGFRRASSTDSILGGGSDAGGGGGDGGAGAAKMGGITVEQTVNVVLDDMDGSVGSRTGVEGNCVRVTRDATKGAGGVLGV